MNQSEGRILVVDDEFSVRDSLLSWFEKDGYEVTAAENASEALRSLESGRYQVALLDIRMPGMDGMALLERLREIDPELAVIIMTAFASVETAVRALKEGAFDYVTKPIDPDELSHLVRRAMDQRRLHEENVRLRRTLDEVSSPEPIVGESPAIREVLKLVNQVAQTDATVLILGESGTGKELIARAIHAASTRRYFPLVPVNCGALPAELLESELFGHEKGAFTGAKQRRKGRIEMASGGTLFLDEVGAIPLRMQVDLLRVLDTHEFTRLGSSQSIRADFRVICATNEDLERAVGEGRFREDFFYRINVVTILAPPLRSRRSDIRLLAEHFLDQLGQRMNKRFTGFSSDAMELLASYHWPGNVRELCNAVERAMVVGRPPTIRSEDMPVWRSPVGMETGSSRLADMERRHIGRVLDETGWNIARAAELLDVDRTTVYNKIKKHDLDPPPARSSAR